MFSFIWVRPDALRHLQSGSFVFFLAPWGMPIVMPDLHFWDNRWQRGPGTPVCVYEWSTMWRARA